MGSLQKTTTRNFIGIWLLAASLLTTACIPTTTIIQDGHDSIQKTEEHNIWGQNVVSITRCRNVDKIDGFCPSTMHAIIQTVQAPGPWLAGYVLGAGAIIGGAFLIKTGMENHAVPQQAPAVGPVNVSTWNQGLPKGNW